MSDANNNPKRVRTSEEGTNPTPGKKRCDPRAEAVPVHREHATQAKAAAAAKLAKARADAEGGIAASSRPTGFILPGFEKTAKAAGIEQSFEQSLIHNPRMAQALAKTPLDKE